jgi:hypothetical protein
VVPDGMVLVANSLVGGLVAFVSGDVDDTTIPADVDDPPLPGIELTLTGDEEMVSALPDRVGSALLKVKPEELSDGISDGPPKVLGAPAGNVELA